MTGGGAQTVPGGTRAAKGRVICWALLLSSGVIYGSSFSFMKIAMSDGARPLGMVLWFALLATLVLGAELGLTGRLPRPTVGLLAFCIPWGILSVVLPNFLFFLASSRIPSSLVATAIALVPILTLAGAIALGREVLTAGRLAGILLGAAAAMLILLPRSSLPAPGDAVFVLAAFAGAACYATEHLYIESRAPAGVAVDRLLFLMFAAVTLLLLPVVLATGTFFLPHWPPGRNETAMIAVTGVTLLDYFIITLLVLWAGPVFTSQAAYVVTLAGVIWGILLFGERHSLWIWVAIAMLFAGLSLVRPRQARRRRTGGADAS